jgi:hypothetical protein
MWRVFWVPQDAVRSGVRRRLLAGWEDLRAREDDAGVRETRFSCRRITGLTRC